MEDLDRIKKRVGATEKEEHRRKVEKLAMQNYISRGFDPFRDKDLSKMETCVLIAERMIEDFNKIYDKR